MEVEDKMNIDEHSIENNLENTTENICENNTTNCLALTIVKDHKIVAFKNVFIRSIRMSWKIIVSSITLTILKLFS